MHPIRDLVACEINRVPVFARVIEILGVGRPDFAVLDNAQQPGLSCVMVKGVDGLCRKYAQGVRPHLQYFSLPCRSKGRCLRMTRCILVGPARPRACCPAIRGLSRDTQLAE
jgi:hypothetical protein